MVYNKDLLRQAGITRFPETWEELRQASRQIKQKTGKAGWGFPAGSGSTNSIWFFCNFYWWSHGWALVDRAPDGKYVMNITLDQIAEAFDYYNSYFKEGHNDKALLAVTNWGAQELIEGMVQGNIAIISTPGVRPHPDRGTPTRRATRASRSRSPPRSTRRTGTAPRPSSAVDSSGST